MGLSAAATVFLSLAYPVGSIFTSVVATNPGTLLGIGTWTAFGAGRVPVGLDAAQTEFDTVEETGGAKTVALSTAELASHTHTGPSHVHAVDPPSTTTSSDSHDHAVDQVNNAPPADGQPDPSGAGTGSPNANFRTDTDAHNHTVDIASFDAAAAGTGATGSAGSGTAHQNLQPYIVVYMWKRTA